MYPRETVYAHLVCRAAGLLTAAAYDAWLHEAFLAEDADPLLTDLELAGEGPEERARAWSDARYREELTPDWEEAGRQIMALLRRRFSKRPEELLAAEPQLRELWRSLPEELRFEDPFLTLGNLDAHHTNWWADVPGELRKLLAE